jgi:benzoyl-CoA reductase/2-hydroxyglutaryl-CoA dehydratase subunit BcrC/BadD/HgdB
MNEKSIRKKEKRLVRNISRQAAGELAQLREIPDSPGELDYFYDIMESVFVRNDLESVLGEENRGKPVIGVYCMVVPEELIYAAGAVPIRLCAGCYDSSQLGEDRVPRDGCPLVKSAMGLSMQSGLDLFDLCDVVIVPTTCDAKRKLGEELSAFKEVWLLETPHVKDSNASRRMWMEQVYALKSRVEAYAGNGRGKNRITSGRLSAATAQSAHCQSEIRRLLSIRKDGRPVIWGRQTTAVINSYAYAALPDWSGALARLNETLEADVHREHSICGENRPRVLIAGSPAIFPNLKIPTLVEEMGGVVVFDESCAGDRYLYDPVGHTEKSLGDQMAGIASRYLAPCVCPSFAPNDDRLFLIRRMAKEYAADGVLYHVLKGCVIYDFEVHRMEKNLKEINVPLLRIETDYNPEDVEQLRTRIEAFIEMLGVRKRKARSEEL